MRDIDLHGQLKTWLVATKLPEGKALFDIAGVSESPSSLESFARRCGGCPAEIQIVRAADVGVEFHGENGIHAWSAEQAANRFCVIIDKEGSK